MKFGFILFNNGKSQTNFLTKPRLWLWGKSTLAILSISFLLAALLREQEELKFLVSQRTAIRAFIYGFAIYPISLVIQALTWSLIIRRLGSTTSGWYDVEIYAYTYLMRHLPSAIWYLTSRTVAYQEQRVGAHIVLSASGIEWMLLIIAAGLVYSSTRYDLGIPLIILILPTLWLISHKGLLRKAKSWKWIPTVVHRWAKIFSQIIVLPLKDVAFWSGLYAICYIVGGVILFLLIRDIAPTAIVHITLIDAIGVWALTAGISFLTSSIVPLGMGIRELTLATLLYPDLSITEGAFVSLFMRILFLISDLVWAGLIWAITRLIRYRS